MVIVKNNKTDACKFWCIQDIQSILLFYLLQLTTVLHPDIIPLQSVPQTQPLPA
jgi:hypothetical protein